MVGAKIGPYTFRSKLGEGGMGAVYLAHDARLNRDVAIKVLPAPFARDPDRLTRFNREAQALAALSHPHIAHVYGLEELDGTAALVMEYVPGRTLEAVLAAGPLPLADVISIARQIAEGLEAAHEKGIVHRDLKPANVMVAADGRIKILDFGLAKVIAEPEEPGLQMPGGSDPQAQSLSPTMLSPAPFGRGPERPNQGRGTMTVQGVILGTAAYMSPEQARGRAVDKRSDIWAFGVVLWELLTGRRPFGGDTMTDTLAAIVGAEPPWSDLPANTPDAVQRLLRRCLDKDPHQRLRDIGEARIALLPSASGGSPAGGSMPAAEVPARRRVWKRTMRWAVPAMGLLLLVVAADSLRRARPDAIAPLMTFDVDTARGTRLRLFERPALDISRDGSTIAYAAADGDALRIYVRRREDPVARALPVQIERQVRQGGDIAFSPDGRFLAVTDGLGVARVPFDGGPPVRLAPVLAGTRGLAWVDDRTIVYSPAPRAGLRAVDPNGGEPRDLTTLANDERSHRWPSALPGGRAMLFSVGALGSPDSYDDASIDALVLATGERRRILAGASFARYAPGGKLIYARGPSLYAVDFDPDRLVVSGAPKLVVARVATDPNTGATHFAVAQDGTLVYVVGSPGAGQRQLVWTDRSGETRPVDLPPGVFNDPTIAPDGTRAALLVGPIGHGDVWIYDFRQTTFTRLTSDGRSATPVWSADGRFVYYVSIDTPKRRTTVFRRLADGSGQPEAVASTDRRAYLGSVLRDGTSAIGAANAWAGSFQIVRIPLGTQQPLQTLTDPQTQAYGAALSPDERWIAYSSERSGRREVYVQALSGTGQSLVSTGGGEETHWAPDGSALYYRVDDRLMSVPVQRARAFVAGKPTLLLRGMYDLQSETGLSYAVDPRTGRFLMIRLADDPATVVDDSVRVVLNWAGQLAK